MKFCKRKKQIFTRSHDDTLFERSSHKKLKSSCAYITFRPVGRAWYVMDRCANLQVQLVYEGWRSWTKYMITAIDVSSFFKVVKPSIPLFCLLIFKVMKPSIRPFLCCFLSILENLSSFIMDTGASVHDLGVTLDISLAFTDHISNIPLTSYFH